MTADFVSPYLDVCLAAAEFRRSVRNAAISSAPNACCILMLMTPALALSPAEQRGKTFALTNCARCHSIDRVTQSPLKIAPPFRTLHLRYPVETLGEALAEGIETGHPTMPAFQLDPDQIHDLLSYLKTPRIDHCGTLLQGMYGPGDHVPGDSAKGVVEGRDGRLRLDLASFWLSSNRRAATTFPSLSTILADKPISAVGSDIHRNPEPPDIDQKLEIGLS